ncbi:YciI family protein [Chitinophaga sp. 212800010-3]|uniref:YciI family protein n=1 Tax=unclassified Chitinophaga TaxID=2619133 RepID=UPI002DF2C434|nr:YCII domain-containing protein [Chitinophaga sp. 212800010-3]
MKEFLMLIREGAAYDQMSPEEMQACVAKHVEWVNSLTQKGQYKDANPLETVGAVIRGNMVTDGPYIESKECVSGYYILLAGSLEEAITIAKGCPDLAMGCTLEVREMTNLNDQEN